MSQAALNAEQIFETVAADASFSVKRARLFLHFLSETGRVMASAKLAGFKDADSLYSRRKRDPEFAKAWAEAIDRAGDVFEDEAARRAVEGVDKDVYYKGEVVGQERQYSDGLLGKLLDGAKPGKYQPKKESQTNINVQVGLAVVPMTAPHLEEWERGSIDMHASQQQMIDVTQPVAPDKQPIPLGQKIVRA